MITQQEATRLKGAITMLVNASIAADNAGVNDPADAYLIREACTDAKIRLDRMLLHMTIQPLAPTNLVWPAIESVAS